MIIKHTTKESADRTQTVRIPLKNVQKVHSVKVDTGSVDILDVGKDYVEVKVSGGSYTRREVISGSYTPSDTKYVTGQTSSYYNKGGYSGSLSRYLYSGSYTPSDTKTVRISKELGFYYRFKYYEMFKSWELIEEALTYDRSRKDYRKYYYNQNGYKGTLSLENPGMHELSWARCLSGKRPEGPAENGKEVAVTCYSGEGFYEGSVTRPSSDTRVYRYRGDVTKPASDTRVYKNYYEYVVTVEYEDNLAPVLKDNTVGNKTLYESSILTLQGTATDDDGDVVTVKYSINNGKDYSLSAGVKSTSYYTSLTFKRGYLYDKETKVSGVLSDNSKYTLKIWAEDDKNAKSEVKEIIFYVVNNRPAAIQINPIEEKTDLVETDYFKITGKIEDPEKDETTLSYKINTKPYVKVGKGENREFEIMIPVNELTQGENQILVRAEDSYGAITEKTVLLERQGVSIPLKEGILEYEMVVPDTDTKGLLLWIEREVGDLEIEVSLKFGDNNEYVKLEKKSTGNVETGKVEEDEYLFEQETAVKGDIYLRIVMKRKSTNSTQGIKKISGVYI